MLFEQRLRDGLHDGTITVAYRRWRRSQVLAGHRYRTGRDLVRVEAVDQVETADIDVAAARDAGYDAVADLLRDLRGGPEVPLYRIRFRRLAEPDPRDELAEAAALTPGDVAAIAARLRRMDGGGAEPDRGQASDLVGRAGQRARLGASGPEAPYPAPQGTGPDDQPRGRVPAVPARRGLPARGG
jgi:hypothetical protein